MSLRVRFKTRAPDFRPVTFPPPGPYWCSGEGDGYWILIAYLHSGEELQEFWPEAEDVDVEPREITFTSRFPQPDWWTDELAEAWSAAEDES